MDISSLLAHNQFASGGLLLGIVGGIVAWSRNVPVRLMGFVRRQWSISVSIYSDNDLFGHLSVWLHRQSQVAAPTTLLVASLDRVLFPGEGRKYTIVFSPADGSHIVRFRGKYIWMHRDKEKEAGYGGSSLSYYRLRFIGRDRRFVNDFFDEVWSTAIDNTKKQRVYYLSDGLWTKLCERVPRGIDTVISADGIKEQALSDLVNFCAEGQWYRELGLPYRRGYLLYGPPGNGKSSLVSALAGVVNRDVYVLSLAARDLDDTKLAAAVLGVSAHGVLLIEDVDSAFAERDKSNEHSSLVTFSGLLNAIDGIGAGDNGQVIFMTTNHIERLDPALIRPGRVDLQLFISSATSSQILTLYQRFFPDSTLDERNRFLTTLPPDVSMADVQNRLLILSKAVLDIKAAA